MTSLASAPVMRATSLPASRLWTGRVITGLTVAFLTFDAVGKLLRITPVVEASQRYLLGLFLAFANDRDLDCLANCRVGDKAR